MLRIKIIDSDFFKNNAILVSFEILPLVPTAEFCTIPTDNSTTFGILKLGDPSWHATFFNAACLDLSLLLVLEDSWLV